MQGMLNGTLMIPVVSVRQIYWIHQLIQHATDRWHLPFKLSTSSTNGPTKRDKMIELMKDRESTGCMY